MKSVKRKYHSVLWYIRILFISVGHSSRIPTELLLNILPYRQFESAYKKLILIVYSLIYGSSFLNMLSGLNMKPFAIGK